MRIAIAGAVAMALMAAGCGGESGDLIAVEVSGGAQARPVELVVTGDGRGTCDGSEQRKLPSELVIDAREAERELSELASEGTDYGGPSEQRRGYVARMDAGTVRWQEGRTEPEVLGKAALLALRLERELCG